MLFLPCVQVEGDMIKKCISCGKDTERHLRAVYCWPCQGAAKQNNDKKSTARQKRLRQAQKRGESIAISKVS
jgi:hypothetical protein